MASEEEKLQQQRQADSDVLRLALYIYAVTIFGLLIVLFEWLGTQKVTIISSSESPRISVEENVTSIGVRVGMFVKFKTSGKIVLYSQGQNTCVAVAPWNVVDRINRAHSRIILKISRTRKVFAKGFRVGAPECRNNGISTAYGKKTVERYGTPSAQLKRESSAIKQAESIRTTREIKAAQARKHAEQVRTNAAFKKRNELARKRDQEEIKKKRLARQIKRARVNVLATNTRVEETVSDGVTSLIIHKRKFIYFRATGPVALFTPDRDTCIGIAPWRQVTKHTQNQRFILIKGRSSSPIFVGGYNTGARECEIRGISSRYAKRSVRRFKKSRAKRARSTRRNSYRPPPGWRLKDGPCSKNIQYVSQIRGWICEM